MMNHTGIEEVLATAEQAVASGQGLRGTGFWATVATVKGNPELTERYGGRIAAIDTAAFRAWAMLVVPILPGTVLAVIATVGGLVLVGWAYSLSGMAAVVVFYLGFGIVLVTTHGLAHLIVGLIGRIRFTAWYIGEVGRPQPGVKIDYRSYLKASPSARAWMHASGAIVTKIVPFAFIGAAVAAGLPTWAVVILPVIGVLSIITDVLWSTKKSDWAKYKREIALVHTS